jgi:hypothetical protein
LETLDDRDLFGGSEIWVNRLSPFFSSFLSSKAAVVKILSTGCLMVKYEMEDIYLPLRK